MLGVGGGCDRQRAGPPGGELLERKVLCWEEDGRPLCPPPTDIHVLTSGPPECFLVKKDLAGVTKDLELGDYRGSPR